MITPGPVRAVFDFNPFATLLAMFHANDALLRTGTFVESIAARVSVIFVIGNRGIPWRSRPNPWLAVTAVAVVGGVVILPFNQG